MYVCIYMCVCIYIYIYIYVYAYINSPIYKWVNPLSSSTVAEIYGRVLRFNPPIKLKPGMGVQNGLQPVTLI